MFTRTAFGLVTLLAMATVAPTSSGQDAYSLLNELYGRGVHAYFSGQFDQAQRYLDAAVAHGSRDPRCYYFRGLTMARLGRSQESEHEFHRAAQLEFSSEGAYDVARALERIQGPERLWLEKVRQDARLAAMQQPRSQRRTVDNSSTPAEPPGSKSSDAVAPATVEVPLPPEQPDASDPFVRDTEGPIGAGKIEKATVPAEEQANAPGPVADNVAEDPFGTGDATRAPASGEPAATSEDPFATGTEPAPAAADDGSTAKKGKALQSLFNAFGSAISGAGASESSAPPASPPGPAPAAGAPAAKAGNPSAQPAAADDPFGDAGQTATDDVFGQPAAPPGPPQASPPPATAETPPAPPAKAAAGTDDPFGSAAPPAVDDVFGQPTTAGPGATPPPPTAAGASDPAANQTPQTKPAADDPFGAAQAADQDPFGQPSADNKPAQTKPNAQNQPAATKTAAGRAAAQPAADAATDGGNRDQQTDPFADENPF